MKLTNFAALLALAAVPAVAQDAPTGDAAAGEKAFNQCAACHVVEDPSGEVLAGRAGKVGPNLYEVAGRTAGTWDDFKYGKSMVEAGEQGVTWTEENFVGYVQDPTGWLETTLDDKRARGKMMFKVRDEGQAHDLYAFLSTFGGEEGDAAPSN